VARQHHPARFLSPRRCGARCIGFINISLGESVRCTFSEMGIYRRTDN